MPPRYFSTAKLRQQERDYVVRSGSPQHRTQVAARLTAYCKSGIRAAQPPGNSKSLHLPLSRIGWGLPMVASRLGTRFGAEFRGHRRHLPSILKSLLPSFRILSQQLCLSYCLVHAGLFVSVESVVSGLRRKGWTGTAGRGANSSVAFTLCLLSSSDVC